MYDTFVNVRESMLIRLLAYRKFHHSLRTRVPEKLSVLYLNRNGGRRGVKNVDEILDYMRRSNRSELVVEENIPRTFEEQVRSVMSIDIYVSMHGAAMTHIMFMEPFGALIEFNPPKFNEAYYRNMAGKSNLLFYGIYKTSTDNMKYSMAERSTDKILNQWITVPLELFAKTFDLASKKVWDVKYKLCDIYFVC